MPGEWERQIKAAPEAQAQVFQEKIEFVKMLSLPLPHMQLILLLQNSPLQPPQEKALQPRLRPPHPFQDHDLHNTIINID